METGTARYGPVRRVVWGPVANHHRLPDWASLYFALAAAKFGLSGLTPILRSWGITTRPAALDGGATGATQPA